MKGSRYFYYRYHSDNPEKRRYFLWEVKEGGITIVYWKDGTITNGTRYSLEEEIHDNIESGFWVEIPASEAVLMI